MELIPFLFSLVFGLFFTFLFLGSMIGGSMYLFSRIRARLSYQDQEDLEARLLDELDVLRIQVDALSNRLRAIERGAAAETGLLQAGLDAPDSELADAGMTESSDMSDPDDDQDLERSPAEGGPSA